MTWSWQREQILEEFLGKEVIVSGDGQCDSPRHTVKHYFMLFSYGVDQSYILEVEVNDKCYVNFVSVDMEKNTLWSALQWLRGIFNVVEISY